MKKNSESLASFLSNLGNLSLEGINNVMVVLSRKEQKIARYREYLVTAFFLTSIAFLVMYYFKAKEGDAAWLFIQFCIYAALIVIGYVWHKYYGKKMEKIWNRKKRYINLMDKVPAHVEVEIDWI